MVEVWSKKGKKIYSKAAEIPASFRYHREDGPAYITADSNGNTILKIWFLNNVWHRVNGPAYIEYRNGFKKLEIWYQNGLIHRENGPAYVIYDKKGLPSKEKWFYKGLVSRLYGPAIVEYQNSKVQVEHYIINNIKITKEEYEANIFRKAIQTFF